MCVGWYGSEGLAAGSRVWRAEHRVGLNTRIMRVGREGSANENSGG